MQLLSVNVGKPQPIKAKSGMIGIFKQPTTAPVKSASLASPTTPLSTWKITAASIRRSTSSARPITSGGSVNSVVPSPRLDLWREPDDH